MDITVNAINLKSFDFGENDKMCVLFSVEIGKFTAMFKGVKKAAAKLKFASQPFCFGEYTLNVTKGRYIATGCAVNSQFYEISSDIDKYYAGCSILECAELCSEENVKNPALFVLMLKVLKSLCFDEINSAKVLAYFILNAIKISGYKLFLDKCATCGNALTEKIYFSPSDGGFNCGLCRNGLPVEKAVYSSLRLISLTDYEKLGTLKLNPKDLKNCLKLLNYYLNNYVGNLRVLAQYLKNEEI